MIARLATRNIWRNRWRTGLTIGGIAVGVALLVWTLAYIKGMSDAMVRGATSSEHGQVQIAQTEWLDTPSPRHAFPIDDATLQAVRSTEGVANAAPRVHVFGLVGDERTSVVAHISGVDPKPESDTTVVVDGLKSGRWLSPTPPEYPDPREVVLGSGIARQLDAEVGSEVVLFFEASDGSLGNDLLEVVGIVHTGNSAIDRMYAYMHIADVQYAAALEGQIHEIAVRVDSVPDAAEVAKRIAAKHQAALGEEVTIRPWTEVVPAIAKMVEVSNQSDLIMFAIVYLIIAFGIFNTQRMSALERRREFGVTLAIGVAPRQIFGVVVVETLIITLAGAVAGVALGALASWYFVVHGLNLAAFGDVGDFQYMGVSFGSSILFRVDAWVLLKPIIYIVPIALLCGLLPAWNAARVEITNAISGRS